MIKHLGKLSDGARSGAETAGENAVVPDTREKVSAALTPIERIKEVYHYVPEPETVEREELEADWGKVDLGRAMSIFSQIDQVPVEHPGSEIRENDRVRFIKRSMFSLALNAGKGQLAVEGSKILRSDKTLNREEEVFTLRCTDPNIDEEDFLRHEVANFSFRRIDHPDHTEWDMNDRITSPVYRGQGVASKMLKMMEYMTSEYAKVSKKPQELSAEVGQANVLFWLLKNGFQPKTEEDQAKVERLLQGDPSLTIVSAPDAVEAEEKRQWYIFEKETLLDENGQQRSEIWDSKNYGEPIHYMKSSLRIQLVKKVV
jgi:hypothetical protein